MVTKQKFLKDKIKGITDDEVVALFKAEFDVDMNDYREDDIQYSDYENENYKVVSEIDSYGGEGQGEEYFVVSRVFDKKTEESFFIKFDAYYSSWDGIDWSENYWNVVTPKEVKVVKWC